MTEWIDCKDKLPEPLKQVMVKFIITKGSSRGTWIGIDRIYENGTWGYHGEWYGSKGFERLPFRFPPQFWCELPL